LAGKSPSVKRYVVRVEPEERERLEAMVRKGKHRAQALTKARILLMSDSSEAGEGLSDGRIIEALGTNPATVHRTRKQLVEEGLDSVLSRKPRATPSVAKIFDGAAEARLIEPRQSVFRRRHQPGDVPEGRNRRVAVLAVQGRPRST
jgi:hypothetical protein